MSDKNPFTIGLSACFLIASRYDGKMNFNEDIYKGSNGVCNKMKWANACNITWDGITNKDNDCS